jgi:FMN phosphatase YigB (HAD superfamily)
MTALLLDLGDTLVRAGAVLPNVAEALATLSRVVELALVSDYTMPAAADSETIAQLEREYIEVVRAFGLLAFFEPTERRITLSTRAGVTKPDPAIFRLALTRLGLEPSFPKTMFVTENPAHAQAARMLGITAWQFGADFNDWSQVPALVAAKLQAEHAFYDALESVGAVAVDEPLASGQTHAREGAAVRRKRFSID